MRTNIDIDDGLLADAMKALGTKTKKATVEEALRRATRGYRLRAFIERTRGMGWQGDLDAMREGRDFPASEPAEERELAEDEARYDDKK